MPDNLRKYLTIPLRGYIAECRGTVDFDNEKLSVLGNPDIESGNVKLKDFKSADTLGNDSIPCFRSLELLPIVIAEPDARLVIALPTLASRSLRLQSLATGIEASTGPDMHTVFKLVRLELLVDEHVQLVGMVGTELINVSLGAQEIDASSSAAEAVLGDEWSLDAPLIRHLLPRSTLDPGCIEQLMGALLVRCIADAVRTVDVDPPLAEVCPAAHAQDSHVGALNSGNGVMAGVPAANLEWVRHKSFGGFWNHLPEVIRVS